MIKSLEYKHTILELRSFVENLIETYFYFIAYVQDHPKEFDCKEQKISILLEDIKKLDLILTFLK